MLISEAILDYRRILRNQRKPKNTINSYISDIEAFAAYLAPKEHIEEITEEDVLKYTKEALKSYANSSRNRIRTSLRRFFEYLEIHHHIPNHAKKIKIVKEDRKLPKVMSEKEIKTLLDGEPDTPQGILDATIFELIYGSGLRVSELCTLKLNNLSLEERKITVHGKGNKEREIPLSEMSIKRLLEYFPVRDSWNKKKSSLLFINKQGNKVNREYVHVHLKKLLTEKGLSEDFSTHTLRHSFATHLMNEGVNIRVVQELLGHEELSTTQIYTHLEKTKLREEYDRCFPRH